jgi:hypothetical protein
VLGLVLAARRQRDDALSHFQQSLKFDPGNDQTRADYDEALRMLSLR